MRQCLRICGYLLFLFRILYSCPTANTYRQPTACQRYSRVVLCLKISLPISLLVHTLFQRNQASAKFRWFMEQDRQTRVNRPRLVGKYCVAAACTYVIIVFGVVRKRFSETNDLYECACTHNYTIYVHTACVIRLRTGIPDRGLRAYYAHVRARRLTNAVRANS